MPNDQDCFYIELTVDPDKDGIYVSSKQVPGLHLMGSSMNDMRPTLEKAIKRLYLDNKGTDVNVIWLSNAEDFPVAHDVPVRLAVYEKAA
ncbi:MAG: hypothetical protein IIA05_02085 [Proteobacteria bacterium]|nr:hypothetical protein [Pseudomonadota bacterium]